MPPHRRDEARAAFEQFVAESTDCLLRTAYLVTGDAGHAEDLVQEAFFKIARRWPRVASMESPLAYTRRILVNLALDDSKKRSRHHAELMGQFLPDRLAGAFAAPDDRLELIRALGTLPPRQRAVLVLRYFDDLTESEVASVLGCSIGTVKSAASRALDRMRELIPKGDRGSQSAHDVVLVRKGEQR